MSETAAPVVKWSWQFGPYEKDEATCNHRDDHWPHNDTFAIFKCDGETDEALCCECGQRRTFRCNFDEEFK